MYDALALFYDKLMVDYPYDGVINFLQKNTQIAGKQVLDLCTGTANGAIRLARLGAKVTALDASTQMLGTASAKTAKGGTKITFVHGDINNLQIDKRFDIITSFCDGFNYIIKNVAQSVYKTLFDMLGEGGILLFDISTEYKHREVLDGKLYYEDRDDITYFFMNQVQPSRKTIRTHLTFFLPQKGDLYQRYDDISIQYMYSNEEIANLLAEAGFSAEFFDAEGLCPPKPNTERLLVLAKKQ